MTTLTDASPRLVVQLSEADLIGLIRAAVREELATDTLAEIKKPFRAHLSAKEAAAELGCSDRHVRTLVAQETTKRQDVWTAERPNDRTTAWSAAPGP